MKRVKKLLVALLACAMLFSCVVPAMAADTISSKRESVAIIQLWFHQKFEDNVKRPFEEAEIFQEDWGSCFFVGEEGEDPQYLITNYHVVSNYYETGAGKLGYYSGIRYKGNSYTAYGRVKMRVYFNSKDFVEAYPVDVNKTDDVAIFRLDKPTSQRKPIALLTPDESLVGSEAYAIGYPGLSENTFADSTSSWDVTDSTVTKGTISRFLTTEGTGTRNIQIDCEIKSGNSGGPLVTTAGDAIGITSFDVSGASGKTNYAINIASAKALLDRNNIKYTDASKPAPVTTTSADNNNDKKPVPDNKLSTGAIIGIAAGVVVAIGAAVAIILVVTKKNKGGSAPAPAPAYNNVPAAGRPGSEGTTILGSNANTTPSGGAYLINLNTNERVAINKPYFKIGKDPARVDYCVKNPAVSRFHASIVTKGGQYFIIDNATTNFTYINGSKIPANREMRIFNGAKITFADEKFEFRI